MRSVAEQCAGLHDVARLVMQAGCNVWLISHPADVPFLTCGSLEVVYASGDYDIWRDGEPVKFDLSASHAADVLILEYRRLKAARKARTQ